MPYIGEDKTPPHTPQAQNKKREVSTGKLGESFQRVYDTTRTHRNAHVMDWKERRTYVEDVKKILGSTTNPDEVRTEIKRLKRAESSARARYDYKSVDEVVDRQRLLNEFLKDLEKNP